MYIPKYIKNILSRSKYETAHPDYEPGYTLRIYKATEYTSIESLHIECERFVAFARRHGATESAILEAPDQTHYCKHSALVNIYDPVMVKLEPFIPKEDW